MKSFKVYLGNGAVVTVLAEECVNTNPKFIWFMRESRIVAEFHSSDITGWQEEK